LRERGKPIGYSRITFFFNMWEINELLGSYTWKSFVCGSEYQLQPQHEIYSCQWPELNHSVSKLNGVSIAFLWTMNFHHDLSFENSPFLSFFHSIPFITNWNITCAYYCICFSVTYSGSVLSFDSPSFWSSCALWLGFVSFVSTFITDITVSV
jgi:hypothetical protein